VLVTRPQHQSAPLASLIESQGGIAIRFPAIEILAPRDPDAARALMGGLDDFALVIFISPNAVREGLALAKRRPRRARVAAVGEGSAVALERAGFEHVLRPAEGASSEALLALPELDRDTLAGSRVLIVRGEGGRGLLGCTLSQRGARVTYAEVYRRARPRLDAAGVVEQGRAGERARRAPGTRSGCQGRAGGRCRCRRGGAGRGADSVACVSPGRWSVEWRIVSSPLSTSWGCTRALPPSW
jgi:uroporphyrinogen-III synthase